MDLEKILSTVVAIGSDLPAYKLLFDQVVASFGEQDQAKLRQTYADALASADKAHAAAQAL